MLPEFNIPIEQLRGVIIAYEVNEIAEKRTQTPKDTLDIISGKGRITKYRDVDSFEFSKLRNQLAEQGFIKKVDTHTDADRVLQPFILNGVTFKKGNKFLSGESLRSYLKFELNRRYR